MTAYCCRPLSHPGGTTMAWRTAVLAAMTGAALYPVAIRAAGDSEDKAIKVVEEAGCRVRRDTDFKGNPTLSVTFSREPTSLDKSVKLIHKLKNVRSLN